MGVHWDQVVVMHWRRHVAGHKQGSWRRQLVDCWRVVYTSHKGTS